MEKASSPSKPIPAAMEIAFQSKELEELLNIIDQLRSQGISRYIDLPQLIVCGDQSSGKSSVLEAVSGVRFPTKDNLCTRFPTELVLRRSPQSSSSIRIVPDHGRTEQEIAKLQKFRVKDNALEDFGSIVEAAGRVMGLDAGTKVFSTDVLRVELTGPSLPHLTLVDLPGLFHAGNKAQSAAVKSLVKEYMDSPRSIILAVISAKNDYVNQIVTKYAHDIDPNGERTLGIVTKPDFLPAGSDSETQYIELIQNKNVHLRLGWHVLKNRSFEERDCTAAERDKLETAFFSKGVWTTLKPAQVGIDTLKPRLSRVLKDQILTDLPGLIHDIEQEIADCESRLDKLGASRGSRQEQVHYLHQVSQDFSAYVDAAVKGHYNDLIFKDSESGSEYFKRIRAVVFNLLDEFSKEMRAKGRQYEIVTDTPQKKKTGPIQVTREQRLENVRVLIKMHRGMELPGFQKYENITMLLREQCTPWGQIVRKYADLIFEQVKTAIFTFLEESSDQVTADGVLRYIINPSLEKIKEDLDLRVLQNLEQHLQGSPITFNHYFTDNLQKLRAEHEEQIMKQKLASIVNPLGNQNLGLSIESVIKALKTKTEADIDNFTCSEALHFMEAYYKVAIKFFIDDFSIHTIEQGLLNKLATIFNPNRVMALDEATVEDIAGETDESKAERESSSTKLEMLKAALRLLHRLDRGKVRKTKGMLKQASMICDGVEW